MRLPQFVNRVVLVLGLAAGLLGSAFVGAFEVKEGDLKTSFYAKTGVHVVWRYTPNGEVLILDMQGMELLGGGVKVERGERCLAQNSVRRA